MVGAELGRREQQPLVGPNELGMPAAPPFCHLAAVVVVHARPGEEVDRRLPVRAGDAARAVLRLFQVPMLSRLTVPPLRRSHHVGAAVGGVRDVELVAVRVAAEVGQRVDDAGSSSPGPKRSWYHFAAEIPLAPAPTITQS